MQVSTEDAKTYGKQLVELLNAAQFPGQARREVAMLGEFVEALAAGQVSMLAEEGAAEPPAAARKR